MKLNHANAAATICYTTNGATPTASNGVCTVGNSLTPGGTFTLNALGYYPVKAIATAAGSANSNMVSGKVGS